MEQGNCFFYLWPRQALPAIFMPVPKPPSSATIDYYQRAIL